MRLSRNLFLLPILGLVVAMAPPEPALTVRHSEGDLHGFLIARSLEGKTLGDGDLIQFVRKGLVTSRLTLHFRDESAYDETTVFSQLERFHVVSYHQTQKGPTFKSHVDMLFDGRTGRITVHYEDGSGEPKVATEDIKAGETLVNGMIPVLLKNFAKNDFPMKLSVAVAMPKPRVVKVAISQTGLDPFFIDGAKREAIHYTIKAEIGGVEGVLAPLVGKEPKEEHVWVLGGEVPAFLRSEGPLTPDSEPMRVELISPVWKEPAQ